MPVFLAPWFTRLYFALILAFGSLMLHWPNPIPTAPLQAVIGITACFVLACLLLDALQRYRIHELFGLLLVSGLYGLGSLALIHGESAQSDLPYQLVGEALGGQTVIGLGAITLLLWGGKAHSRLQQGLVILIGVMVGILAALQSQLSASNGIAVLLLMGIGLVFVLAAHALAQRYGTTEADSLLLTRGQMALVLGLGLGVLLLHPQGITPFSAVVLALLTAYILLILRVQRRKKAAPLLSHALPLSPVNIYTILKGGLWLLLGVAIGAIISQQAETALLTQLLQSVYLAIGLTWLPAISFVMGIRGVQRQSRHWGH